MRTFRFTTLCFCLSIGTLSIAAPDRAAASDHKIRVESTKKLLGPQLTKIRVRRGDGVLRVVSTKEYELYRGGGGGLADPSLGAVILSPGNVKIENHLKVSSNGTRRKLTHSAYNRTIKITERPAGNTKNMVRTLTVTIPDARQIRKLAGEHNMYDFVFHPSIDKLQVTQTLLVKADGSTRELGMRFRRIDAKTGRSKKLSPSGLTEKLRSALISAINEPSQDPLYLNLMAKDGLRRAEQASRSAWTTPLE